jgi:hypothetical protein
MNQRQRPYRAEYTGSLSNSAVNRRRARSVLNWGTVREHPWVLLAFFILIPAAVYLESSFDLRNAARLAQSVERKALNLVVVGSSPTVGTFCPFR